MNQILIIRNLNAWMNGEQSILDMTREGYPTHDWMLEKGIYCCYSCGHLNSIESERCAGCGDEKFILRKSYENLAIKVEPIKKVRRIEIVPIIRKPHGNCRPVIDVVDNIEYKSVSEAAKANHIKQAVLSHMLIGTLRNKTNLIYKP